MILLSTRDTFTDTYTTSVLTVDGKSFGYVCEDTDRGLASDMPIEEIVRRKVPHLTAIPVGRYRLDWKWSQKHGRCVPWLLDVPGFKYIEIHPGNKPEDTDGCQLPGLHRVPGAVTDSKAACAWLDTRIQNAVNAKDAWYEVTRAPLAWAGRLGAVPALRWPS